MAQRSQAPGAYLCQDTNHQRQCRSVGIPQGSAWLSVAGMTRLPLASTLGGTVIQLLSPAAPLLSALT
jgi:hypothetical protein